MARARSRRLKPPPATKAGARSSFVRLFEQAPALVAVLRGAEHRVEYVNPSLAAIWPRRSWLGRKLGEVAPEWADQGLIASLDTVWSTHQPLTAREFALNGPGGARAFYDLLFHPLHDEQHRFDRVLLLGLDVTEQVLARSRLEPEHDRVHPPPRRDEALFRALLDAAPDPMVLVDPRGRIALLNPAVERTFGYAPDDLLGQPIEILMPARYRHSHLAHMERFFAAPRMRPMGIGLELAAQRRDGSEFPIEVSLSPLKIEGELLVLAVIRDVSERRQVEKLKDEFLSVVSHELRTPLNFITGFASLIDDEAAGPLNAQQHDFLAKILDGASRMTALIDNLLDVSRMAAGQFRLAPVPVDYPRLLEDTMASFAPLAARNGVTLLAHLPQLEPFCMDPQRISQVLGNFLDNALKFTPRGGTVTVRCELTPDGLLTEVRDTGVGLDASDMPRLFRRFSQLDMSTTRRSGGTGLGLFICKSLVEAHGGTIGAESRGPQQGSTFWFRLPANPCDAQAAVR